MTASLRLTRDRASALLLPGRGGLLSSLSLVPAGAAPDASAQELLWLPADFSADATLASGWPGGGAPWLFPFAGRVFHEGRVGFYELPATRAPVDSSGSSGAGRRVLNMPIHGFAYASSWSVKSRTVDTAELCLDSSEATRQLFPFAFRLTARYELTASELRCALRVDASTTNTEPMPVAAGMHPYFRAPLPEQGLERCEVQARPGEMIAVTPAGAAGKAAPLEHQTTAFSHRLTTPLAQNLILGKLASTGAALVDAGAKQAVTVRGEPATAMRYFVLWSRPEQGFYCLEPWMGLPDAVSTGAGVKWMQPGEALNLLVTIGLKSL